MILKYNIHKENFGQLYTVQSVRVSSGLEPTLSVNSIPLKDHRGLYLELDPLSQSSTCHTHSIGIGHQFAG